MTNLADSAFYFCPSLTSVYFEGNAPALGAYSYVFFGDEAATIYYLPGTAGWAGFAANTGLTPVLWNPQVQTAGGGFGVRTNQFGFTVSGTPGLVVVLEASTSLANPAWQPLGTNTLNGGSFYFTIPSGRIIRPVSTASACREARERFSLRRLLQSRNEARLPPISARSYPRNYF